ncbi:MAG: hypothetical protein SFU98_03800 [Leptospiraceae bacterium]|nr:hypothetical protein [Leptospiraceae bacterium]
MKKFVILLILSTGLFADQAITVNQDGTLLRQELTKYQQERLDSMKADIKFFHEKLGAQILFLHKNRKDLFKKDDFSRNEASYTTNNPAELYQIVVNKDTFIQTSAGQISTVTFKVRRSDIGPNGSVVLREVENKFSEDPKQIKLRVYHFPLAFKEKNPVDYIDVDSISKPINRLELVRYYKEALRKTVRELELLIEHDLTQREGTIMTSIEELN